MSMSLGSLSDQARYAELIELLRPEYPFVQLGYHLGARAEPTSRTLRVVREGKHLIKKEYLGQLNGKTENEIALLMAAACKGLQHTASFKSVHAMTCNVNEGNRPSMELLMKNYGLDLEDWLFLFRKAKLKIVESPYFYLAIWHFILKTMKEFHEANFVQIDVKPDNICVALPSFSDATFLDSKGEIALTFNLKELTLIDLGEALHPDVNKRVLLFHTNGLSLGPGNSYISPHYKRQKSLVTVNDMKPLRCLDWRADFYPLGCMADEWNGTVQFPALPPTDLSIDEQQYYPEAINILHQLPLWLKSEDTDPSTEAGYFPHEGLMMRISRVLDLKKWSSLTMTLPVNIESEILNTATPTVTAFDKTLPPLIDSQSIIATTQTRPKTPAKETRFENALSPLHQKLEQAAETKKINRRKTHRRGKSVINFGSEALKWYAKTLAQSNKPRSDVDLLC